MSSKTDYRNFEDLEEESEMKNSEFFPDISRLIIPFSVAFEKNVPQDRYNEDISTPFSEKDKEFREILIYEFLKD